MKKKPRALRGRTAQRAVARSEQKVATLREKLASLEPGGSEQYPLVVSSASVVEPRAESHACVRCQGPLHAQSHDSSLSSEQEPLRVVSLVCKRCGAPRRLYFRIEPPRLH